MSVATKTIATSSASVLQEVILRFVEAAQQRSEFEVDQRARSRRRYHRSWPLSVVMNVDDQLIDMGVALHNASDQGIAFLSPRSVEAGEKLFVRLFWHDEECPRVPAIVRHCTATKTGYLVGCEFVLPSIE